MDVPIVLTPSSGVIVEEVPADVITLGNVTAIANPMEEELEEVSSTIHHHHHQQQQQPPLQR